MTACCVWNASNAAAGGGGSGLDTTVTVGSALWINDPSEGPQYVYGYALGVDYLSESDFGSIGADTFNDATSNSRTVSAIYYTDDYAFSSLGDDLYFCLDQTSVPNTADTFDSIDYNGVNYPRTSAIYTSATGSCSTWRWADVNQTGLTSGTVDLVVNL